MKRRAFACAAAVIAGVVSVAAQQTAQTASIRGRIVAGDTGAPVRGASVMLSALNAAPSTSVTGDDGHFEIRDIAPGRYVLQVTRTGYVTTRYDLAGQTNTYFEIRAGQHINRGDLRLPRAGVITGRIVDTFGDPAAEVSVTAWGLEYFSPGEPRLASVKSTETNDLGEYRLFGLSPGKYFVSAGARGLFVSTGDGDRPRVSANGSIGQAPTFYPGTANGSEAQPIFVRLNEDSPGINIRLQPMSFTRVAGTVVDSSGRPARDFFVMVNPARTDGASYFNMNAAETDANGRFVIPGVPPGDYTVDAVPKAKLESIGQSGSTGDALRFVSETASVPITVTGDPLPELTIPTSLGRQVSGRVLIDDLVVGPETSSKIQVMAMSPLRGAFSSLLSSGMSEVRSDGSFVVQGLKGRVMIRAGSSSLVLQRVVALGSDVTDTGLDVGTSDVTGVEIRLTTKTIEVAGIVNDSAGRATAAGVIVFSEDRQLWMNPQNRRVIGRQTGPDGAFRFTTLPAGSYRIAVVAAFERDRWADPDYLERLRATATPLTLADGDKHTLTLVRR